MVVYVYIYENIDRMGCIGRSVTISTHTYIHPLTLPPHHNASPYHTGKEKKALPVPDMEPKKKRGGKRCVRLVRLGAFWPHNQCRAYVCACETPEARGRWKRLPPPPIPHNQIKIETNRVRKFKERFAMTDMRKEANRRCDSDPGLSLFCLFWGGLGRLVSDDDTYKYVSPSPSTPY